MLKSMGWKKKEILGNKCINIFWYKDTRMAWQMEKERKKRGFRSNADPAAKSAFQEMKVQHIRARANPWSHSKQPGPLTKPLRSRRTRSSSRSPSPDPRAPRSRQYVRSHSPQRQHDYRRFQHTKSTRKPSGKSRRSFSPNGSYDYGAFSPTERFSDNSSREQFSHERRISLEKGSLERHEKLSGERGHKERMDRHLSSQRFSSECTDKSHYSHSSRSSTSHSPEHVRRPPMTPPVARTDVTPMTPPVARTDVTQTPNSLFQEATALGKNVPGIAHIPSTLNNNGNVQDTDERRITSNDTSHNKHIQIEAMTGLSHDASTMNAIGDQINNAIHTYRIDSDITDTEVYNPHQLNDNQSDTNSKGTDDLTIEMDSTNAILEATTPTQDEHSFQPIWSQYEPISKEYSEHQSYFKEENHSLVQSDSNRPVRAADDSFEGGQPISGNSLGLSQQGLEKLLEKKLELEKAYRQDCETFATVVKMLISKEPSLEDRLSYSLKENLKEIGETCISKLQEFLVSTKREEK